MYGFTKRRVTVPEVSSAYLLMCEVLQENQEIVNFDQLVSKMCELGHKEVETSQQDISIAFGWISQFRDVEHPVWGEE